MSKHGSRVRVSYDDLPPSALRQSKDRITSILLRMWKKASQDYGIPQMLRDKEHFISNGEKRRRKKLRKKMAILKGKTEQVQNNNRYDNRGEWNNEM